MSIENIQQLAIDLATAQMLHLAAMRALEDPEALNAIRSQLAGSASDWIHFETKHGSRGFSASNSLNILRSYPDSVPNLSRSWAAGALLTLGDALQREDYLDNAAPLELIYHLRNGVAHGNVFNLTKSGLKRLEQHPAHIGSVAAEAHYEIRPDLQGAVVLDAFVNAGDVHTILLDVVSHLSMLRSR